MDMIERVAAAIGVPEQDGFVCGWSLMAARAAIEAMRPEFEKLAEAYSPRDDDTVWIDDRTPIGLYVDSIINNLSLANQPPKPDIAEGVTGIANPH